jgi:hypothetical protein
VIIRVLGSGQYELSESTVQTLHNLDNGLLAAIEAKDDIRAHRLLDGIIAFVQREGTPIGLDVLVPSDAVLPQDTITIEEVQALLKHEELVGLGSPAT